MAHMRQGIAYYLSNSVKSILQPCFAYLLRVVDYASVSIDVTYSMASPLDGQQSVLFLIDRESLILDTQACLREIFSSKIIHVVSPFKMSQIPSVYFSYNHSPENEKTPVSLTYGSHKTGAGSDGVNIANHIRACMRCYPKRIPSIPVHSAISSV